MSVPSWLNGQSATTAYRWSVAQLAATIAPGLIALQGSMIIAGGQNPGLSHAGIAQASIGIAKAILVELGLKP